MNKNNLRKLILEAQKDLLEILADVSDEYAENTMITNSWSVRDIVAHLVSWVEEFDREVRYILYKGDGTLPWSISTKDNYSEWNQARIDEMKGLSLTDLTLRFKLSNRKFKDLILSLSDEQSGLTAEIPWYYPTHLTILEIVSVKAYHERCHINKLKKSIGSH